MCKCYKIFITISDFFLIDKEKKTLIIYLIYYVDELTFIKLFIIDVISIFFINCILL